MNDCEGFESFWTLLNLAVLQFRMNDCLLEDSTGLLKANYKSSIQCGDKTSCLITSIIICLLSQREIKNGNKKEKLL